jgi:hypothetical protein
VALLLVAVALAGCERSQRETDEYKEQLQALERVWNEGKDARELLQSKQLAPDKRRCSKMYRATVASEYPWNDKDLVELGEEVFDQGCFGIGSSATPELLVEQRAESSHAAKP